MCLRARERESASERVCVCEDVPLRRRLVQGQELASPRQGVSSSLSGPVVPSFRALSGRPKFTVRRHKFNEVALSGRQGTKSLELRARAVESKGFGIFARVLLSESHDQNLAVTVLCVPYSLD